MTVEKLTELAWELNRIFVRVRYGVQESKESLIPWLKIDVDPANGIFSEDRRLAIEEIKKLLAIGDFGKAMGMSEGEYAGKLQRGSWVVKEVEPGRLIYKYTLREELSVGLRDRHQNFMIVVNAYRHLVNTEYEIAR